MSADRVGQAAASVGSTVSVIGREDLDRTQAVFIADALRTKPGVVVSASGGPGGVASVALRGAASGQTLVVIDGVIVNDPASPQGAADASQIEVADLARVEILLGPQALVWGADAIGGVLALESRTLEGAHLDATVEAGGYGTIRGSATAGVGSPDGAWAVATATANSVQGFSRAAGGDEADAYRSVGLSGRTGAALSKGLAADLSLRWRRGRAEIDGFPPPTFMLADTDDEEATESFGAQTRLRHDSRAVQGALSLSFNRQERRGEDGSGQTVYDSHGERLSANYIAKVVIDRSFSVTAGAEGQRQEARTSGVDASAQRAAVFAAAQAMFAPGFAPDSTISVSAGVRRDEYSNFAGATSARGSFAWATGATRRTILRASLGTGFRAPSLFELNYADFGVVPNPDLAPERAVGADIGLEHRRTDGRGGRLFDARATLFWLRTTDLIDFSFAGNGYVNVASARSAGVESSVYWRATPELSIAADYVFLEAVDRAVDEQLPRRPRHRGAVTVTTTPSPRWMLGATLIVNGEENDAPTANDAFARLDLRASWRAGARTELYGRIENALDARYQDISGYAETGAAAYVGARLRL